MNNESKVSCFAHLSDSDTNSSAVKCIDVDLERNLIRLIDDKFNYCHNSDGEWLYFDHIFNPKTNVRRIFDIAIRSLCTGTDSICISYGHKSSIKQLIVLASEFILSSNDTKSVTFSALKIQTKLKIFDLLHSTNRNAVSARRDREAIRKWHIPPSTVHTVTQKKIQRKEDVIKALNHCAKSSKMEHYSSTGHVIYSIQVTEGSGENIQSPPMNICFVDLAESIKSEGSGNRNNPEIRRRRRRESKSINQELLHIEMLLNNIGQKCEVSKLHGCWRVLSPLFVDGDPTISVLFNMSPLMANRESTRDILRFARRIGCKSNESKCFRDGITSEVSVANNETHHIPVVAIELKDPEEVQQERLVQLKQQLSMKDVRISQLDHFIASCTTGEGENADLMGKLWRMEKEENTKLIVQNEELNNTLITVRGEYEAMRRELQELHQCSTGKTETNEAMISKIEQERDRYRRKAVGFQCDLNSIRQYITELSRPSPGEAMSKQEMKSRRRPLEIMQGITTIVGNASTSSKSKSALIAKLENMNERFRQKLINSEQKISKLKNTLHIKTSRIKMMKDQAQRAKQHYQEQREANERMKSQLEEYVDQRCSVNIGNKSETMHRVLMEIGNILSRGGDIDDIVNMTKENQLSDEAQNVMAQMARIMSKSFILTPSPETETVNTMQSRREDHKSQMEGFQRIQSKTIPRGGFLFTLLLICAFAIGNNWEGMQQNIETGFEVINTRITGSNDQSKFPSWLPDMFHLTRSSKPDKSTFLSVWSSGFGFESHDSLPPQQSVSDWYLSIGIVLGFMLLIISDKCLLLCFPFLW